MSRFVVTKTVEGTMAYVAVVDATGAAEAKEIAGKDDLNWKDDGFVENDAPDFSNVAPELVSDDFEFGASDLETMFLEMLEKLKLSRSMIVAQAALLGIFGDVEKSPFIAEIETTIAKAEFSDFFGSAE